MATIKHTIEIEVTTETEAKAARALADKYTFTYQGLKQLDDYYMATGFSLAGSLVKKMIKRKK